jgi:phosphatidylinositol alpha-1,6-mannosyltransferase
MHRVREGSARFDELRTRAAGRALILAPSRGLGGGIERYLETIEWSFDSQDILWHRIDLERPGYLGHLRMLMNGRELLQAATVPTRIVVGHRSLLPVAALLARHAKVTGVSLICHGSEVWDARWRARRTTERWLMRQPRVRVVAVSPFTAGALTADCQATVLAPGLSKDWFNHLVRANEGRPSLTQGLRLITVFRMASWQEKGLGELVGAIESLDIKDIRLTICGSGSPPPALLNLIHGREWCLLRHDLKDEELAFELASADLFVLATRTRSGQSSCGEGFGMVLMEAQVAGVPVVAPAHGGSGSAFIEGVTGTAPSEDTVTGLSERLRDILADRGRLAWMADRAIDWARLTFDPDHYAELACRRLL